MRGKRGFAVFLFAVMVTVLSGCSVKDVKMAGSTGATIYQKYINNLMECSYYGDTAKYTEVCDGTQQDAQDTYDATVGYYAYELMALNEVDYEYISDDVYDKYVDLAERIMAKVKFTVNEATKVGDDWQVKIQIQPIDINDTTWDEVEEVVTNYNAKIDTLDTTGMSDEELSALYIQLEDEYALAVYDVFEAHLSTIGYKDEVSKIVLIETDEDGYYGISDDDWNDIDDIVVDMKGRITN
jgi:hypothetical protein